jgi:hypothetical protein
MESHHSSARLFVYGMRDADSFRDKWRCAHSNAHLPLLA